MAQNVDPKEYFLRGDLYGMISTLESSIHGQSGVWQLNDELESLKETYTAMLRFTVGGYHDDKFSSNKASLIKSAHNLYHRVNRQRRLFDKSSTYYSTLVSLRNDNTMENALQRLTGVGRCATKNRSDLAERVIDQEEYDMRTRQNETRRDNTLTSLFNRIWTSDLWGVSDYETAKEILASDAIDDRDKALLVGAVTISVLNFLDEKKAALLFDAYDLSICQASQRAIIGIALMLFHYGDWVKPYTSITERYRLALDNHKFCTDLFMALTLLQMSRHTDEVTNKVTNDIMPALLKSKGFTNGQDGLKEALEKGANPDWFKEPEGKALDKAQEMVRMQAEGADVYVGTFSHMKHDSFFSTPAHWLFPFYETHPRLRVTEGATPTERENISKVLTGMMPFCDSDTYSFCLMLDMAGIDAKRTIANEMLAKKAEEEADAGMAIAKDKRSDIRVMRSYVFDLFRLFRLRGTTFAGTFDPFDKKGENFSPLHSALLREAAERNPENTVTLAESFMQNGFYADALELFNSLRPQEREEDLHIWQKLGFCEEKLGRWESCYPDYIIADSIKPMSKWTLKRRLNAAVKNRQYDDAAACAEQLSTIDPDNALRWLRSEASALMQKKDYANAIPVLYKCDLMEEDNPSVCAMLGWALLMTGKRDKALASYGKAYETTGEASTITEFGHCLFALESYSEAYNKYAEAYALVKDKTAATNAEDAAAKDKAAYDTFTQTFNEKAEELISRGADKELLSAFREAAAAQIR